MLKIPIVDIDPPPLKGLKKCYIKNGRMINQQGQTVILRGVNLSGDNKMPFGQNTFDIDSKTFFETKNTSFIGRPFPLEEADIHFSRLKEYGFNCIRFNITWESLEHAGP